MSNYRGNNGNHGKKGKSGRMKMGDESFLKDLFDGGVDIGEINKRTKFEEFSVKTEKGVVEKRMELTFASGRDAFAYKVLRGDEKMLSKLMDKLYADKREVEATIKGKLLILDD